MERRGGAHGGKLYEPARLRRSGGELLSPGAPSHVERLADPRYALVRGRSPELAIPVYNEILARSPENVTAMRRLAVVLLAKSQSQELLKLAERLDRVSNGAVIGSTLRAVVYHNDKNPEMAVAAFERVLELDPELREMPLARDLFWTHLADDLVSSGRIDDARRILAKALSNTPDPTLWNRLGQIHFLQGGAR